MLPLHEHIVGELVQEDCLVVIGAGLGLPKVLASLLRLHSASHGVVFILSASDTQCQAIREELLEQDRAFPLPADINNEFTSADRLTFYSQGGSFFITSRILIVDLLNERVPLHKVAGLILLNAHRLSDTCTESFIARLYRAGNRKGFIRAFSDRPQAMISGFSKTERIMRSLFVKRLHLWPRFQMSITTALEENPPEVIDLRVPLTSSMQGIHAAIIEVMDACLKELRKMNKVDVEDLTVENGLFKSFDEIIRRQLDPIWHTLSWKIKQLVADLATLRKLADYLMCYDAVTFLKYLDTLRASEDVRSLWIFANPTHKIFELAKRRVFQIIKIDTGTPISLDKGYLEINKSGRGCTKQGRGRGNGARRGFSEVGKKQPEGFDSFDRNTKRMKLQESADMLEKSNEADLIDGGRDANASEDGQVGTGASTSASDAAAQGVEVVVMAEEMPKWKVLREVLEEIEAEKHKLSTDSSTLDTWDDGGIVLVACKDERTCLQLQDVISKGPQKLMNEEWDRYLLGKAELRGMRSRRKRDKPSKGFGILSGRASGKIFKEDNANMLRQEEDALLAAAAEVSAREVIELGGRATRGRGRGRGRGRERRATVEKGRQMKLTDTVNSNIPDIAVSDADCISRLVKDHSTDQSSLAPEENGSHPEEKLTDSKKLPVDTETGRLDLPVQFYALESEQRILDILKPSYVIVYDPDMAFVREMEVYKAEHSYKTLKVYFLFYENSTEVQKFEASIRRENSAFESLIRQKATMMIPVDQDGRLLDKAANTQSPTSYNLNSVTRKAGGRKGPEKQMQVVVDMREFGSSLPCVLHQQGMKILPVTLEVGDYILSPDICVERKSVTDLFQSFASGRLYHQAETMIRYYRIPVLLIEFSQDKSFSFQSANEVAEDIVPTNIVSKLSLLVLHFPRLRLVWSRSLHATAEIFTTLKSNQDEPDIEKAMRVGVPTEDGLIEGDLRAENYNSTAVELLQRLPGVTNANYRSLMDGCNSLAELACLPLEKLAELMGGYRPARMLRDFLDAKCPNLV